MRFTSCWRHFLKPFKWCSLWHADLTPQVMSTDWSSELKFLELFWVPQLRTFLTNLENWIQWPMFSPHHWSQSLIESLIHSFIKGIVKRIYRASVMGHHYSKHWSYKREQNHPNRTHSLGRKQTGQLGHSALTAMQRVKSGHWSSFTKGGYDILPCKGEELNEKKSFLWCVLYGANEASPLPPAKSQIIK